MTSTDELESQIHAQDCELEYWFQQAENYAEVQIPADDLRAIIARTYAVVNAIARTYAAANALPELLALRETLRETVDWYDKEHPMRQADWHNPKCGCVRCKFDRARAALKETGQ